MFKTLSILSLSLLATSAYAVDFTGHWTVNTGTMTSKDGWTGQTSATPCSLVDIQIEHVPTQLTIKKYHAICGSMNSDWGPSVMEIRDGKIFEKDEDGEPVEDGTLEGDLLKTLQPSGSVEYAFNLRLKTPDAGQPFVLESYYGVRNAVGAIVVEGKLQRTSGDEEEAR